MNELIKEAYSLEVIGYIKVTKKVYKVKCREGFFCLKFVEDNGLIFFQKQLPYPENKVFHKFTVENWESIHNFHKVFPHDFFYLDIMLYPEYPDYIFFCSDERSWRVLVYTRGEKPHKLIEQYREKYDFVRVREVAPGWYDISS